MNQTTQKLTENNFAEKLKLTLTWWLNFLLKKCSCNMRIVMMMNWVVVMLRDPLRLIKFSLRDSAAVEFITEIIFNIFHVLPLRLKHYPTWCRRFVGRTFVDHLSQFDGFFNAFYFQVEKIFKCLIFKPFKNWIWWGKNWDIGGGINSEHAKKKQP